MGKNFRKKLAMMLVVTVVAVLVLMPQPAECVFGIPLNPCTLPECTAQCKKILGSKFMSASCITNPKGQICLCFG
ncbi:hypothetical protein Fmac_001064 [Flemingia macrophylla]|uniref:Uncharacterized protein n=1 Tax=Flemingia macrophylla TaxID=520843 RepID=A0ABD1NG26_9FABA